MLRPVTRPPTHKLLKWDGSPVPQRHKFHPRASELASTIDVMANVLLELLLSGLHVNACQCDRNKRQHAARRQLSAVIPLEISKAMIPKPSYVNMLEFHLRMPFASCRRNAWAWALGCSPHDSGRVGWPWHPALYHIHHHYYARWHYRLRSHQY